MPKLSEVGATNFNNITVDTAALEANSVTSAKIATTVIQRATVVLTNAQVKALRATPVTLVAAPAAGNYLEFISISLFLHAGANVLTESTANLAVKYTDGSGVQVSDTIEMTGFIDQAVDTITHGRAKLDPIVAKTGADNKALVLHNLGAGEFAGNAAADATLSAKITYRSHTSS